MYRQSEVSGVAQHPMMERTMLTFADPTFNTNPGNSGMAELILGRRDLRRHARYTLNVALPATLGRLDAMIVDISHGGARLRHEHAIGMKELQLRFRWAGSQFNDNVVFVSSKLLRTSSSGLPSYETRVRFLNLSDASEEAIRRAIGTLDNERVQKYLSNFRGDGSEEESFDDVTPPTEFYLYTNFGGTWQKFRTPFLEDCPSNGFLVPVSVPEGEIRKICRLFPLLDDDGQQLMRCVTVQLR